MRPFIDYPSLTIPNEYPVEEFKKSQVLSVPPDRPKSGFEEECIYQCVYDKNLTGPYYTPKGLEDTTLVFESRFESGNLATAIKTYVSATRRIANPFTITCDTEAQSLTISIFDRT